MEAQPDYASYVKCMEEIKRRLRAIDEVTDGSRNTTFKQTNIEFVGLQFRKIFELIILATLASHQHLFEGLTRKLSKEWQIEKIIAIVKKKNAAFYPKPIDRVPSQKPQVKDEWVDIKDGFLTLVDLKAAHGQLGFAMHATNPYRETNLLNELEKEFPVWRKKMMRLLNNHLVEFPDNKTVLYVGMQSLEFGSVHTSLFARQA